MRFEKKTFEIEYRVFDVGERVRCVSRDCSLYGERDYWIVTEYLPALYAGDEAIIFLEGEQNGHEASHFEEYHENQS